MSVQSENTNAKSRRGFALGGLAALAAVVLARLPFRSAKDNPAPKKIKLLAQDGTLIEVDEHRIENQGMRKLSTEELQHWVTRK